jgi:hypothetical protein
MHNTLDHAMPQAAGVCRTRAGTPREMPVSRCDEQTVVVVGRLKRQIAAIRAAVNTSRGQIASSQALLEALRTQVSSIAR